MKAMDDDLSLLEWRAADGVCDHLELLWRQRSRPRIEEYLERVEERIRPVLAAELLRIEMEWRLRLGEQPSLEEYRDRFPFLAGTLADWLAEASAAVTARSSASTSFP